MTTTDPKLIEPVVSHLANRFLQYPLPKDFRPDNGVSVQRPNYAPDVPWTIYGTNLLNAEQAKAMARFMLEGAPVAAAINEAVQNAGQWQDIATAPRDGTPILITRDTRFESEEGWHVVRWDDDWWQVHCGKFDHPLRGAEPTHWMPLPSPPAIEAHKESGHG